MGLASVGKFLDDAFNNGNFQDQRLRRKIAEQDVTYRKLAGDRAQREEMRHISNDSMRFATDQQKFGQGARRVAADGTVEDILQIPKQIGNIMPDSMAVRRQAGPDVSTIIDPQGRPSQYETMGFDELQKRGSRLHAENILADMATKARGNQLERSTHGSPRSVGGQTVQMLPDEIAKNAGIFEEQGQQIVIPGAEGFGPVSPKNWSEVANILQAMKQPRPAAARLTEPELTMLANDPTATPERRQQARAALKDLGGLRQASRAAQKETISDEEKEAKREKAEAHKDVRALQVKEQAIHQKRIKIAADAAGAETSKTANKKTRAKAATEMAALQAQVDEFQTQQKAIMARFGGGGSTAAAKGGGKSRLDKYRKQY